MTAFCSTAFVVNVRYLPTVHVLYLYSAGVIPSHSQLASLVNSG